MLRKIVCMFIAVIFVTGGALALASGPVSFSCAPAPCAPRTYAPGVPGNQSAYWGDAPLPGLCGGIVALPFLIVGSLLGGNTTGNVAPRFAQAGFSPSCAPAPAYNCRPVACAPQAPIYCAPMPCPPMAPVNCAPPCPPAPISYAPMPCPPAPVKCAVPYPGGVVYSGVPQFAAPAVQNQSILSGLPCLDLCSGLLGNLTGGANIF